MSLFLTALTRIASCVFLFAVILYAPGFVPALVLPKWVFHTRSRAPAVGCSRRLAEADVRPVRHGPVRPAPDRVEAAACVPAYAYRA